MSQTFVQITNRFGHTMVVSKEQAKDMQKRSELMEDTQIEDIPDEEEPKAPAAKSPAKEPKAPAAKS